MFKRLLRISLPGGCEWLFAEMGYRRMLGGCGENAGRTLGECGTEASVAGGGAYSYGKIFAALFRKISAAIKAVTCEYNNENYPIF
jgi:hypothetical protein